MCSKHQPRGCLHFPPHPSHGPKRRKNTCFGLHIRAELPKSFGWNDQNTNPLLKMAAGAPKMRTHCSKWQLEHPKFEPFAQNGCWSAKSTNPLLEMAAGAPKVRTLCSKWQLEHLKYEPFARNCIWRAQSIKPVSKMQVGASKVRSEMKALCFNLWVAPN